MGLVLGGDVRKEEVDVGAAPQRSQRRVGRAVAVGEGRLERGPGARLELQPVVAEIVEQTPDRQRQRQRQRWWWRRRQQFGHSVVVAAAAAAEYVHGGGEELLREESVHVHTLSRQALGAEAGLESGLRDVQMTEVVVGDHLCDGGGGGGRQHRCRYRIQ